MSCGHSGGGGRMDKEELIQLEGSILDALPDGRFRVRLDNGHEILAYTSGRMKKAHIRVLAGDRVTVEMTPYDLSKGRITFRQKVEGVPAQPSARRPQFRRR